MIFFILLFFSPLSLAAKGNPGWSTQGIEGRIRSDQTIKALKDSRDCDKSASASSVLEIQKALEIADRERKQKFVCEVKKNIEEKNRETVKDRKFMLNYLQTGKNNPKKLTEEDHLQMAEKMIKYRLLRDKDYREYFVPSTRWTPPEEVKRKTSEMARAYVEKYGPPSSCFFIRKKIVRRAKLKSKKCHNEVLQRVQTIPYPLIVTQSVLESGWGSSSLAMEEKNILGLQVAFGDPSSMSDYPNCKRAKKNSRRCLLRFDDYRGSIYEYFARFNGSHFKGYEKYRKNRLGLYRQAKNDNQCKLSTVLSKSVHFYAENKRYVKKIQSMIDDICTLSKNCENQVFTAKNGNDKNDKNTL